MRWVWLLLASCAALGASRVARAAPLSVEWRAPPCAAQAEFRARVRDALRREPEAVLEQELSVVLEIAENADKSGYFLRVEMAGGARSLETPSCDEAVAAAAIVVALAIDPNAMSPTPAPAPPAPEPKASPAPSTARPRETLELFVAVGAGVSLGEAPAPSPLLVGALGLRWRAFGAQLEGLWLASQTALLPGDAARGGQIGLAGAGLALCVSPLREKWRLSACLAGQAGAWRSRGVAVANPEQHNEPWLSAVARLGAGVSLSSSFGLFLSADVVVPARTPSFELEDLGRVYRPNAVAARLSAGPELRF